VINWAESRMLVTRTYLELDGESFSKKLIFMTTYEIQQQPEV